MSKRPAQVSKPDIHLDASLPISLYQQLYDRFRQAILTGQLTQGTRLPSTRQLASELGISRSTTALAYQQLLLEGYLESRVGQGTTVACHIPTAYQPAQRRQMPKQHVREHNQPAVQLSHLIPTLQAIPPSDHPKEGTPPYFRSGEPAIDLFPYEVWARLITRRARHSLQAMASYQDPAGYYPLREAIAAHIGITRGVRCTPESIILTAGSQGALDLAARTLLDPGDSVWVENPGYFGARGALLATGARLVPVPVDAEGIVVRSGRERGPKARLVATTPSHQFPTGVTMSLSRRLELLEWANQEDAWILEDDYDSEYRLSGRPLEALQGMDQQGHVLYVGTFSKVLFPALRVGYLVAPPALIAPLLAMRRFIDVHIPILEQMALFDFLHEGHFARHLRHMLAHYRQRRDVLHQALRTQMHGLLDIRPPEAGMHLMGWLPPHIDDRRASLLAASVGVEVTPVSQYSIEPLPRGGLLFGYASTNEQDILIGVQKLAKAFVHL